MQLQPDIGVDAPDTAPDAAPQPVRVQPDPLRLAVGNQVHVRVRVGSQSVDLDQVTLQTTPAGIADISADGALLGVSAGSFDLVVGVDGREVSVPGEIVEPRWTDLAVYDNLTCALDAQGQIYCAGAIEFSDTFKGNYRRSFGELHALVAPQHFNALAVNGIAVCALDQQGQIWCRGQRWEPSTDGGDTYDNDFKPVEPAGAVRFTQIVAGDAHFCALSDQGRVYCWGLNGDEQLGDDDFNLQRIRAVDLPSGITSLAAGDGHNCALGPNRRAYCWGNNDGGQLGTGNRYGPELPAPTVFDDRFDQLAAGRNHTCGMRDGKVYCWGLNQEYQLGFDRRAHDPYFQFDPKAAGTLNITKIVAARQSTCALNKWGQVVCWGDNIQDELGGEPTEAQTPARASQIRFADIALSGTHACGLTLDGQMRCWGMDRCGALAVGRQVSFATPQLVDAQGGTLAAGGKHTCRVADGTLSCWGDNYQFQFGDGSLRSAGAPRVLSTGWSDVAAGATVSCGLKDDAAYCWGIGYDWELGTRQQYDGSSSPNKVLGVHAGATDIEATGRSVLVRYPAPARPLLWGGGVHTTTPLSALIPGADATQNQFFDLIAASPGSFHGCGLREETQDPPLQYPAGHVHCWGDDPALLGDPSYGRRVFDAVPVASDKMFHAVAAGARHTCALSVDGELFCWGELFADQGLLDTPTQVTTDAALQTLAGGGGHFGCGLTGDGKAYCWGRNTSGTLGDGTFTDRDEPVALAGAIQFRTLALGANHACGVAVDDKVYCWGDNSVGQLGIGAQLYYQTPQQVVVSQEPM